jgi:predicted site-specific integrase-resolvase
MSLKQIDGPEDLMTAADAGRILGISVDMVRLLARGGRLPFLSTISGMRLFRRKDVNALLRRRERDRRKNARAR